MQDFIKHFIREPDGSWQCVSPATLQTSKGRIQVTRGSRFSPGTVFMGVDIAAWLDIEASSRMSDSQKRA